jgi:phosphopantothenoylcysteine decarboxylase/phosphopantothenate--cysteine ligase
MLKDKKIIIGVTGSIAAYKAAILIRLLIKEGAQVKVLMTESAKQFITPLTLATLSKNPVFIESFNSESGDWNSHVDLGIWADAYLIAPASANSISKITYGIADNLLLTTYLSVRCPVFFAPAMDLDMYQHVVIQQNITTLQNRGHIVIEPSEGELASGLEGKGRMEEPEKIVEILNKYFAQGSAEKKKLIPDFKGKRVLITAGPTYESIDPVRFIGNFSSGKMGFSLANAFAESGAEVILISGPTNLVPEKSLKQCVFVKSADEMYKQCIKFFPLIDIAVLSAAVADYKAEVTSSQKIKSSSDKLTVNLVKTVDIANELGKIKSQKQILVGFALETENEIQNARLKMSKKNFDLIVLNSLNDEGAGFGHDTNKISILDRHNNIHNFGLASKKQVASDIIKIIYKEAELHKMTISDNQK